MTRIVLKFGGTSVADVPCYQKAAAIVKRVANEGNEVIVVVSSMAGVTDQILANCDKLSSGSRTDRDTLAARDTALAAGEQSSAGFMEQALIQLGLRARSWNARELNLWSDSQYGNATLDIEKIKKEETAMAKLLPSCNQGQIAVVTGFQGTSNEGRTTTLGRGGSDASAVAIAVITEAQECRLYKNDVDGVSRVDPVIVPEAQRLITIPCDDMWALALNGSKILNTKAIEIARDWTMPIWVLRTSDVPTGGTSLGTHVIGRSDIDNGPERIIGIAHAKMDSPDKERIALVGISLSETTRGQMLHELKALSVDVSTFQRDKYSMSAAVEASCVPVILNRLHGAFKLGQLAA